MDTQKRSEVEIYIFWEISLDGFIARNNGEIDWLGKFNSDDPNEDYGFGEFFKRMDSWSWAERALRKFSAFRSGLIQGTLSGIKSDFDISSSYSIWFGGTDTKTDSGRAFGLLAGIRMAAYLLGWRRSSKIVSRVRFGKTTYSNTYSHNLGYWQTAIRKYASRNHPKTPPYQEYCFRISAIGLCGSLNNLDQPK